MTYDILFILVIFLSNIIQTITGFAGTVLAMPISMKLVGQNMAKPVLNLVAIVVSLYIAIRHYHDIDWKQLLLILLFVGLGFALGFVIEELPLEQKIVLYVYGGFIILLAIAFFFLDFEKVNLPTWLMFLLLIVGGVIHKLYVSGGPLVVIYGMHKLHNKNAFRSTLSCLWVVLNSILFVDEEVHGLFVSETWILFAIGAGVSLLSLCIGSLIAPKLSKKVFMKITCVLLLISGVTLLL